MQKKKILLISLGSIGRRHLKNTRELLPNAEIAVFRQYTKNDGVVPVGADILLGSIGDAISFAPDAVIISSPATEHVRYSLPFIERGIPVFLEKPLSHTSDHIDEFATIVTESNVFLMIGYVLRFLPILHEVRSLMAAGTLGRVLTAHVEVGQYLPDWRPETDYRLGVSAQKSLGGGCLLELSHELDYATWLFGLPDSVICSASKLSDLDIDVEDSAQVFLEYGPQNGSKTVHVQLDFLQRTANMFLQIVGTEATLQADLINENLLLKTPSNPNGTAVDATRLENGNELYLRQFDYFFSRSLKAYQDRFEETASFKDAVDVRHAANVMRLIDLAKASNAKGKRLHFPGEQDVK
ncbi:Gfo/Idh/MocA family protein [Thalassospira tepidiphila]|uniref:Gfo/Idh/MocA family protein n=1 Tax=Thalassospira tepidiphila TaxID=393657 RepID=UPI0029257C71|nr:oxidoreductase [Thalassospira tepidiphila]